MGNLLWHDLCRLISIASSIHAVRASFRGILFRKFFWDFVGGILRNPGGIQPSPKVGVFVKVIVKVSVVQLITTTLALEYPLPFVRRLPVHRSMPLRIILLALQSFLSVLFYQGTNASLWSLIAAVFYIRALTLGERIEGPNADKARASQA